MTADTNVPAEELRFDGENGPFTFNDFHEFYGDLDETKKAWAAGIPADSEKGRAIIAAAKAAATAADANQETTDPQSAEPDLQLEMDPELQKKADRKLKRVQMRKQRELENQVEAVAVKVATVGDDSPVVEDLEEIPDAPAKEEAEYDWAAEMEEMEVEMERLIEKKMKRVALRKLRMKESRINLEDNSHLQLALLPEDEDLQLVVKEKKKKREDSDSEAEEKRKKKLKKRMLKAFENNPIVPKPMGPGMLDVISGGKAGPVPTSSKPVCHRYLLGDCQNVAALCPFDHPTSQAECEKWAKYFMTLECKRGDACMSQKCLYNHPTGGPRLNGIRSVAGTAL